MGLVVQRPQLHGLAAAHDDVEAAVGEALEHREVARQAADLAHAGVIVEHDAERLGAGQAPPDELPVARLEDVQRQELAGKQHERQRKDWHVGDPRHRDAAYSVPRKRSSSLQCR